MRSCGFSVDANLIEVCEKLGKVIPNDANFRVFNRTKRKTINVNVSINIESIFKKLSLKVDSNDTFCCSLEGNKLLIETQTDVDVKIRGTVLENKIQL